MPASVISIQHLSKKYGDFTAVNGISFNGVALLAADGTPDLVNGKSYTNSPEAVSIALERRSGSPVSGGRIADVADAFDALMQERLGRIEVDMFTVDGKASDDVLATVKARVKEAFKKAPGQSLASRLPNRALTLTVPDATLSNRAMAVLDSPCST